MSVIVLVLIFRGQNILSIIQYALVLTVAGIPAALPVVLSVTMAVGAIALAKKEAIVSKLVAIEEMASMDVLCSDKTGTITTKMRSLWREPNLMPNSKKMTYYCSARSSFKRRRSGSHR